MSKFEDNFCGGQFWNYSLVWQSEQPDFTPCFQKTILSWIPLTTILLFSLFELPSYLSRTNKNRNIRLNPYNISKLFLTLLLILVNVAELICILFAHQDEYAGSIIYPADYTFGITFLVSHMLSFILLLLSLKYGVRASYTQFLFYFVCVVCESIIFRSLILQNKESNNLFIPPWMITLQFGLSIILFFLNFFADRGPTQFDNALKDFQNGPEISASVPSKFTFAWVTSLIWKGLRNTLDATMLWTLHPTISSNGLYPIFHSFFGPVANKAKCKNRLKNDTTKNTSEKQTNEEKIKISVFSSLLKTFGYEFFLGSFFQVLVVGMSIVGPQIQKAMILYVNQNILVDPFKDPYAFAWKGIFYASLLLASSLLYNICNGQYNNKMYLVSMKVRTCLNSTIYRKSLRLSNTSRKESTVGQIVNLMQVDVSMIMALLPYVNMAWSSPIQALLFIYMMYRELGVAIFAGLGVFILAVPLNVFIARKQKNYQFALMKEKDKRVKLINEILGGMKVIKLYGWEPSFMNQVQDVRDNEVTNLKKFAWVNAAISLVFTILPYLSLMASFTTYIFMSDDNKLTAEKAFVTASYMSALSMQIVFLPMIIVYLVQAGVSLKRINTFMNNDELDDDAVQHDQDVPDKIHIQNGNFRWAENDPNVLSDINLSIKPGSLTAVVGAVGSGKSSLLSACLGDMVKESGAVNVVGSTAYVPQQAWIQNATVQDNILFGKPLDKPVYESIVNACALGPDFKILPGGDQTEIGEKGINLSGGQKQRVSLARAVYSNSELFLLDDPLSAVDSHVGKHIFNQVISNEEGLLKNKTRVLVTHGVAYLQKVDYIVVVKEGRISEQGSYAELLQQKGDFAEFLLEYVVKHDGSDEEQEEVKEQLRQSVGTEALQKQLSRVSSNREESIAQECKKLSTRESVDGKSETSKKKYEENTNDHQQPPPTQKAGTKLIADENIETGNVALQVYYHYIKSIGLTAALVIFVLTILSEGARVGSSKWMSIWTDETAGNSSIPKNRNMYLGVYGSFGVAIGVINAVLVIYFSISTLRASTTMHNHMLERVMKSPMSFFDTTPIGRVINRFSSDVSSCDQTLPGTLRNLINLSFHFVGTAVIIMTVIPIFAAVVFPVVILFYVIQRIYVSTSRQLKRLESNSKSPIYSHFGETLNGLSTIRAFNMQKSFIDECEKRIDNNQRCYYPMIMSNRWLDFVTQTIGSFLTFSAAVIAMSSDSVKPGDVGLIITNATMVTYLLPYLVRSFAEVETNIVAVERIKEYSDIAQEADWNSPESQKLSTNWPTSGAINFDKCAMRYREGLDLVLKDISCIINGGEKVGIVGRTGAGKSSLTMALFRLAEASNGGISIDEEDIANIGLHDLRTKLTIIPQEPVLFAGSLRMNLDPFNIYKDERIWAVLKLSHLHDFVSSLKDGIHHKVSEGGDNLSVGQRQLLCLARALLKKTKILVLDEATAAVDLETDDLIQGTIREEFKDSTVLTIAHRLNTIMDYDRIMVLDNGHIAEFESVKELLKNEDGKFYSMAKSAGLLAIQEEIIENATM